MKGFGRLVELHRLLLSHRQPVATAEIQRRLQCSRATVMRLVADLRTMTKDPIPYDRDSGGFRYHEPEKQRAGLPSLWFSPAELYALLVIRHQLRQMQPGFLAEALASLDQRLAELLAYDGIGADEIARRVRLISLSRNPEVRVTFFPQCAEAVLQRKRLAIRYRSRTTDETTEREISPLRLVAYRDNWYLDAWCHVRQGARRFAVDRLQAVIMLDASAIEYPDGELESHFAAGYGIFSGSSNAIAVLRFSAERARWVADEVWHREQQGLFLPDGRYELRVPYGEPAELIMEILKYGPDVEVLAPGDLRQVVVGRLRAALQGYPDADRPE